MDEHTHVPPDPNRGVVVAEPPTRRAHTAAVVAGVITVLVLAMAAIAVGAG